MAVRTLPLAVCNSRISSRPIYSRRIRTNRLVHTKSCRVHQVRAQIGFTSEPEINVRKNAEDLLRDASTILLFQSVLKTPVSQNFLKVLLAVSKSTDASKVAQAYGEFYNDMAGKGHSSWLDYLMDRIVAGNDIPLAAALEKGDPHLHLTPAAAVDLDALQRLAVAESTLASWVKDQSYKQALQGPWIAAASTLRAGSPETVGADATLDIFSSAVSPTGGTYLAPPLGEAGRAAWRQHMGGKWRWSDGIEDLMFCYKTYGHGLVGANSVLLWKGGSLKKGTSMDVCEAEPSDHPAHKATLEVYPQASAALRKNALRHARGLPAAHALVHGAGGPAKNILLHDAALHAARSMGLRVVLCPPSELGSWVELAKVLRHHPRARFLVLVDVLGVREGDNAHVALSTMLGGAIEPVPSNALIYAAALDTDTRTEALLRERMGLNVKLAGLSKEDYLRCLNIFVEAESRLAGEDIIISDEEAVAFATTNIDTEGAYSVQLAQQCVAASVLTQ